MKSKRMVGIIGLLLTLMVLQLGCSASNPSGGQPADQDKAVMEAFQQQLIDNTDLPMLFQFLDDNIALVSKEDASRMVIEVERVQIETLQDLSGAYYAVDVQQQYHLDNIDLDLIEDEELKKLIIETREGGYRIETSEGEFYPIIDYGYYKRYSSFVTSDIKDYLDMMAVESDEIAMKDAALMISWDELLGRALNQEQFILTHGDSERIDEVKDLFKRYTYFVFYGVDNTPVFSYGKIRTVVPEAKESYEKIGSPEGTRLQQAIHDYLSIIVSNNDRLTDEVEGFREEAYEELLALK